jgi:hypothetical protein
VRYYYGDSIENFLLEDKAKILGLLTQGSGYGVDQEQLSAWEEQVRILQRQLAGLSGKIFFEFIIPRMGKRVDVILVLEDFVAVIEFKVGATKFAASALDQVWDYALDLKNFHQTSHNVLLIPILIATAAEVQPLLLGTYEHGDRVLSPIVAGANQLRELLDRVLTEERYRFNKVSDWDAGTYLPTPTIVEAALALYGGHNVEEILCRGAENLASTVSSVQSIIEDARLKKKKTICFVTGVPGAGKTLVGLDVATQNIDKNSESYSVYLSGNGPLVKVLQEALALDKVNSDRSDGKKTTKSEARSAVKAFIQNVHHFRDECISNASAPPPEHVVIFDESQRAWNLEMTSDFMRRKKGVAGFNLSEPEFLISCMDRHNDWAVVVCLVGGGQEINRGEAGVEEWLAALQRSFGHWSIYCSPQIIESMPNELNMPVAPDSAQLVTEIKGLHLSISMRSFRAARLSELINSILARDEKIAKSALASIGERYPILLTRDVEKGREWLRNKARGSERYGMVVSSKAYRLKPHAIDVRIAVDPIHWFLGKKNDVRSSFYLEDVATEFQIQGLELDWVCVTWDADLRFNAGEWSHYNFVGSKWQRVNKPENQKYLENAYRVLMTRARQGMIIVVPEGSSDDPTRDRTFYDPTYKYLRSLGIQEI